jgi:iron complex outermembrane recepter protein
LTETDTPFSVGSSYYLDTFARKNNVFQIANYDSRSSNDTYSTNLDLTGHFDTLNLKHTLLIGGDYYREDTLTNSGFQDKAFFDGLDNFPNNLNKINRIDLFNPIHGLNRFVRDDRFPPSDTLTTTDQYGIYIQDQIKLPYDFHVMGGIRWQYIHQKSASRDPTGISSPLEAQTQDAVTPRVGILWQPKKWLSVYANYAESFGANSGRTFISPGNYGVVPPTSAEQYEGGIKLSLFDGRLRANLAYYDLTKTIVPATDFAHDDCGGGPLSFDCTLAAGEVRSRGPELDITGEILPGWNVIATWANTDVRLTKSNPQNDNIVVPVGGRWIGMPRNTASFFTTYDFQQEPLKGFSLGGGVTLQDAQLVGSRINQSGTFLLPGFATVSLNAGYTFKFNDAEVTAQFNVDNLLDKRYFTSAFTEGLFGQPNQIGGAPNGNDPKQSALFGNYGAPRMFMGSISIQY